MINNFIYSIMNFKLVFENYVHNVEVDGVKVIIIVYITNLILLIIIIQIRFYFCFGIQRDKKNLKN